MHLIGFIIKEFVTMHGHMNVKHVTKFGRMRSDDIYNLYFMSNIDRTGKQQG